MNIPNWIVGPIVDKNGYPTAEASLFFQNLISALQTQAGTEGIVIPTLTAAQITIVQNNKNIDGQYTCQLGTMIRQSGSPDKLMVAMDGGGGVPLFKEITVV